MRGAALSRGVVHQDVPPTVFRGTVIHGFGRGSKQLGCPTANLPTGPYAEKLGSLPLGVYWGLARVGGSEGAGEVHGMALNLGWSPFFGNAEKTIEV